MHDVDLTASALRTTGGSIDLEELGGVGVGLGASNAPADTVIRPFPRVYPDVGGIVGGVVAEAGPQPLAALPEHVSLYSPATELPDRRAARSGPAASPRRSTARRRLKARASTPAAG